MLCPWYRVQQPSSPSKRSTFRDLIERYTLRQTPTTGLYVHGTRTSRYGLMVGRMQPIFSMYNAVGNPDRFTTRPATLPNFGKLLMISNPTRL